MYKKTERISEEDEPRVRAFGQNGDSFATALSKVLDAAEAWEKSQKNARHTGDAIG